MLCKRELLRLRTGQPHLSEADVQSWEESERSSNASPRWERGKLRPRKSKGLAKAVSPIGAELVPQQKPPDLGRCFSCCAPGCLLTWQERQGVPGENADQAGSVEEESKPTETDLASGQQDRQWPPGVISPFLVSSCLKFPQ